MASALRRHLARCRHRLLQYIAMAMPVNSSSHCRQMCATTRRCAARACPGAPLLTGCDTGALVGLSDTVALTGGGFGTVALMRFDTAALAGRSSAFALPRVRLGLSPQKSRSVDFILCPFSVPRSVTVSNTGALVCRFGKRVLLYKYYCHPPQKPPKKPVTAATMRTTITGSTTASLAV